VLVAEGVFSFHTVKHHSSYKRAYCTSFLFKTIFPDSEIARKFWASWSTTKTNSAIAPHTIDNIMQTLKNNTLSCCGVATYAGSHNAVKVFPVVIQYFDRKNCGLQSKLIEVQQQSNEAADTPAQYIKGNLKKRVFLICRISAFLTICYFSKLFLISIVLKIQTISMFF